VLYEMSSDVAKYLELRNGKPGPALRKYVENWAKMFAPIAPHIAEEVWHEILGKDSFISVETWPAMDPKKRDAQAELLISYVDRLVDDVKSILRVYKGEAKSLVVAVAKPDSWQIARIVASYVSKGGQLRDAIRAVISSGVPGKEAAHIVRKLYEFLRSVDEAVLTLMESVQEFDEKEAVTKLKDYISRKTGIQKVEVYYVDEADGKIPQQKLKQVIPLRPAILIA
ncbi:MAG TPA: leucine--tRNA ligase, partial [Pyrodictium delaneyi]|nr:leucine--tRNA ligase [Pyrodictium delaneyi]